MSRFLDNKYNSLKPYTPGEQPQGKSYIKLNTNELPYAPSVQAQRAAAEQLESLRLYPDPAATCLKAPLAESFGVLPENVFVANGSDEVLAFCFMALCPKGASFADITYGFYSVYAALYGVDAEIIPLSDDFSIDVSEYMGEERTIFIANPNAPTGIALSLEVVEKLVAQNSQRLVIIDEAYVDFGAQSAVPLTKKYDNLMVVGTFSKSRAMAGARLGYAVANRELIADLERIKFSFNPYNVSRPTMAAGAAAIADVAYFEQCIDKVVATRQWTNEQLKSLGFELTDSRANFIFARHTRMNAQDIYEKLKQKGILVRWFDAPRIRNFLRISIGTDENMRALVDAVKHILAEK